MISYNRHSIASFVQSLVLKSYIVLKPTHSEELGKCFHFVRACTVPASPWYCLFWSCTILQLIWMCFCFTVHSQSAVLQLQYSHSQNDKCCTPVNVLFYSNKCTTLFQCFLVPTYVSALTVPSSGHNLHNLQCIKFTFTTYCKSLSLSITYLPVCSDQLIFVVSLHSITHTHHTAVNTAQYVQPLLCLTETNTIYIYISII